MQYNHQLQKSTKTELQKLLAVLPIYIYFFFITIHTILTKDGLIAKSISAVCFIIFATMFLLALRNIFENKKRIN
ncbi:hypothetical protein V2W23_11840 [Staphylococcus gallinarum]|jgi:predicted neutral ceramidase superfamily lipid hydrolase|uniref:hypothetical protein n=1 Tax=Staphylococcus gallinarum TaxID=1293 RepID=UPI000D1E0C47|nr:hypothetical protein [Staphylococcus gallinarum]MCD8871450.1 hypothetical protein [Staphylococcus gallinarum]PTL06090.1 hypothetical protein BUZ09_12700 [Staphylococcus gallinarum]PTL09634.1 hypothetical protein BUZ15_07480 [Staphylococcus gallinarum]RIL35492.1 hypothetical protein BUY98_01045 [Staphylococcus gallinarum]RIO73861.1 hypothetical protein BUZ12_13505 [Staphylococcus gallinarum]